MRHPTSPPSKEKKLRGKTVPAAGVQKKKGKGKRKEKVKENVKEESKRKRKRKEKGRIVKEKK